MHVSLAILCVSICCFLAGLYIGKMNPFMPITSKNIKKSFMKLPIAARKSLIKWLNDECIDNTKS